MMNKTEFNHCYKACEDLLMQLDLTPSDKRLKEMLFEADSSDTEITIQESPAEADSITIPSFQKLLDSLRYADETHSEETELYLNSKKMDAFYSKTAHGKTADIHNLFTRAFNTYVVDKLYAEGNNKQYVYNEYETLNAIWYKDYYTIKPQGEERTRLFSLFDIFIQDLKVNNLVKAYSLPEKMTMTDVNNIIERRKQRSKKDTTTRVASKYYQ